MSGIIDKTVLSLVAAVVLLTMSILVSSGTIDRESEPQITVVADHVSKEPPLNPDDDQSEHSEPVPQVKPETKKNPVEEQTDLNNDGLKHETRAITSWAGVTATSKKEVDELVALVDAAHLNVIFLLVYARGAYFEPSHVRFPDEQERLPNLATFEDGYSDALSYLLAIRDERRADDDPTNDFEVHAWISVHMGGEIVEGQDWPPEDKTKPGMLNYLFPEFKLKYAPYYSEQDHRFVKHDTSVIQQPKFRAYMTNLLAGLAEDYDVDGIFLDYIRTGGICFNDEPLDYPGTEYDYPGCQEDYKAWTRETYGREYTLWEDTTENGLWIRDGESGRVNAWQARAVGMLVESIHDEVKAVRPDVIISATEEGRAIYWLVEDKSKSLQGRLNWEWLDRGWTDATFVMMYNTNTQWIGDTIQRIRDITEKDSSDSKIFPLLVTHDLRNQSELWSYVIIEQVEAMMHGQWVGQPLEPPTKGVALFRAERLSEEAITLLAEGPFKEPALPFWGE